VAECEKAWISWKKCAKWKQGHYCKNRQQRKSVIYGEKVWLKGTDVAKEKDVAKWENMWQSGERCG
jgi:hypothetical protein